jgi:hypothetical protein
VALLDGAATADARYRPEVRRLALALVAGLPKLDAAHIAPAIHAAVRDHIRFVGEGIETFDDPIATWMQRAGDCDDFARLLLALYRALGLKARLVAWERLGKGGGHATVQVWDGTAWRWAEASIKARFGEEPKDAYRRLHPRGGGARAELGELAGLGDLEVELASDAARHARARSLMLGAWPGVPGAPPASPPAVQAAHAIALLETSLGAWPGVPAMASSHNWGAVQVPGVHPPCPPGSQESGDTHANGSKYRACFRVYPDDAAGVADFLGVLFAGRARRAALETGDADELARAMVTPPAYAEAFPPGDRGGVQGAGRGRVVGSRVARGPVGRTRGNGCRGARRCGLVPLGASSWVIPPRSCSRRSPPFGRTRRPSRSSRPGRGRRWTF